MIKQRFLFAYANLILEVAQRVCYDETKDIGLEVINRIFSCDFLVGVDQSGIYISEMFISG